MALFRQELAIDLGTANTVIFKDGDVVLDEPSIIATDTKSGKLMALGNHAQLMEEHTPPGITTIRPLMNGVIADYDAAEMMLTGFIRKATGQKTGAFSRLLRPAMRIVIGIRFDQSPRVYRDSVHHPVIAGFILTDHVVGGCKPVCIGVVINEIKTDQPAKLIHPGSFLKNGELRPE